MQRMFGFGDPATHAWMVLDEVRTSAFATAIDRVVRPGDVVLDIGTGSGILALLAAKAGARRVFAVEAMSGAAELAAGHVAANGLSGVVEVIRADFADVAALPEPPRVVISETLGHFAPDENLHENFRRAIALAAPEPALIASAYRFVLAAARTPALVEEHERLQDYRGVALPNLATALVSRVDTLSLSLDDLAGPEVEGPLIAVTDRAPEEVRASLPVTTAGPVTGIVVSFAAQLGGGVELRTTVGAPPTCWGQVLFPLHPPLLCSAGDVLEVAIHPRVVTDRGTYAWEATGPAGKRQGDGLRAVLGDPDAMLERLGFQRKDSRVAPSARLAAWAAAMGGEVPSEVDQMVHRLVESMPERYPDAPTARAEVLRLLRASKALY